MSNTLFVAEMENGSPVFRKRSFAMQTSSRSNNQKSNVSDVDEPDINDNPSVFPENDAYSQSLPVGHSFAHTFSGISSISDSVSSTETVFSSSDTDNLASPSVNPSLNISHSTAQTLSSSDVNSNPEDSEITDDVSVGNSAVHAIPKSDVNSKPDDTHATNNLTLSTCHSKSLDDLLTINPAQKSVSLPRVCVSSSNLDKVDDDSDDDEDYVIPFLPNSDEDDGYVIASLLPCSKDEYLTMKSNDTDDYDEIKEFTLQTLSLTSSTTYDDDFRTRSDSDAYDYVKDFTLPISPLSLNKTCSDTNDYDEVKDFLQETPSLCSSTASVKRGKDHPLIRSDSDYEEIKDYVLQAV